MLLTCRGQFKYKAYGVPVYYDKEIASYFCIVESNGFAVYLNSQSAEKLEEEILRCLRK